MELLSEKNSPSGKILTVKLDPEDSNISKFPFTIDIQAIKDISRTVSRESNLNSKLDSIGIKNQVFREKLLEKVTNSRIDIISFVDS